MRVCCDLDGSLVGFVMRDGEIALSPNRKLIKTLEQLKAGGDTLILWTFGNEAWLKTVCSMFPALCGLFDEFYTRESFPMKVTTGRGVPEPIKDIRLVDGDILIDNDEAHYEWAKRHGLEKKYVLIPTYGVA